MTEDTGNGRRDQRVTNARIWAELKTMNGRLKNVESTTATTAAHSIRCATKWDQYEKDEERRALARTEQADQTQTNEAAASSKQIAKIAGVVAIVVAVINLISLVLLAVVQRLL